MGPGGRLLVVAWWSESGEKKQDRYLYNTIIYITLLMTDY
jgi:hypothetical protein